MSLRSFLLACVLIFGFGSPAWASPDPFARENLVAWCIVPYDAQQRGPEERAQMLERLGIKRLAYDYRAQHIPTFEAEMEALARHHLELTAWWFPGTLNDEARNILQVIERHGLHPQLWVTGGGKPTNGPVEQAQRAEEEAARLRPIAEEAARLGLKVALYNHGGWFGDPENQLAILARLALPNVGLVYNFHHGGEDMDRFQPLFMKMQPHLLALNLSGMSRNAEGRSAEGILPLGAGTEELRMLRVVRDSTWQGSIGILNHVAAQDAEVGLRANMEALERLRTALAADYYTIPAAPTAELTPANGWPGADSYRTWERSLGGPTSNRFSALTSINRSNVAQLQLAWTYHSGDGTGNIQCNPIIADGVMYAPTSGGFIVALEAATGRELWRYQPEKQGKRLEDAPARRGLVLWRGSADAPSRLLFTCGYWIYALDPQTGQPIATFGEQGRTALPMGGTAAGAVWQRVFVIPGYLGDVFGYDVVSGRELWRFHTVPKGTEFAAETWENAQDGANCWGGMALDESRGIAYFSTGSPKTNFIGTGHLGPNLFANCVLALKAETGERLWHFQEIRHDIWDLDIPAPPNLVTVMRDGKLVDAVAQVTKIGNTLVLDRVTGQPLYPFRLRRAPASLLQGERTEQYQPDVETPEPFARQLFTREDITTRTPEAHTAIEQLLARANVGWFVPFEEARPTAFYGLHGGAEWTGAAVDPTKHRLYVSANTIPWMINVFRDDDPPPAKPQTAGEQTYFLYCAPCHGPDRVGLGMAPPLRGLRHRMTEEQVRALWQTGKNAMPPQPQLAGAEGQPLLDFLFAKDRPAPPLVPGTPPKYAFGGYQKLLDPEGYPGCRPPWGTLNCLDLDTGKLLWTKPLGRYPELEAKGLMNTGTENFGGATVTAGGLVFCSGTRDNQIRAFDSETGAELWVAGLPLHGSAAPATYEVDGRQYIVIAATGGGKLGGPSGGRVGGVCAAERREPSNRKLALRATPVERPGRVPRRQGWGQTWPPYCRRNKPLNQRVSAFTPTPAEAAV